jgi:hypothetical protein
MSPMLLRPRDAEALALAGPPDHTLELPAGVQGRSGIDPGGALDIGCGNEAISDPMLGPGLVGGGWLPVNGDGAEKLG